MRPIAFLLVVVATLTGVLALTFPASGSGHEDVAPIFGVKCAEAAHGEHEKRTGQRDANWPDWYAEYMVRESAGEELPQ